LSSTAGLAPGDLLLVNSLAVWKNNIHGQKQGELRYIQSISGNFVTLTEPLEDTYKTSDTGRVQKVTPVKDITVSGLRFINIVDYKNLFGVVVYYGVNIHITGCYFEKIEQEAMDFSQTINSKVDYNTIYKSYMNGMGYGTALGWACQDIIVEYNEYHECRHSIAIGGGSGQGGIPRHITMQHNKSYDSVFLDPTTGSYGVSHQYDCHNVGEDINYLYNEATGRGDGMGGMGCYTGLYEGNNLHDLTGSGIVMYNPYSINVVIKNNIIKNVGGYGIELGAIIPDYGNQNIKINGNSINGCGYDGIIFIKTTASSAFNNTISNCNEYGIYLYSTTTGCQVYGNTITNSGVQNIRNDGTGNSIN
jgi:hypothetical protein